MSERPQKYCPACQAGLDLSEKRCPYCRQPQLSRAEIVLERLLHSLLPQKLPATRFLVFVNSILFILLAIDITLHPDFTLYHALMNPPGELVERWGAHTRGEFCWWRLFTANFVHFGIIHIIFNMSALRYVGAYVERTFGPALTFASFVFCGFCSMLVSNLFGDSGLVAGASGAIMAFAGMACVAAHKEHTSFSFKIRNSMITVAAATIALGFVINQSVGHGIDNIAHCAGFASGLLAGVLLPKCSLTGLNRRWKLRLANTACFAAFLLSSVSFGFLTSDSVFNKTQNQCHVDLKIKNYSKAVASCGKAYAANPSDAKALRNAILANELAQNRKEAQNLCIYGQKRFGRLNPGRALPFDPLCDELLPPAIRHPSSVTSASSAAKSQSQQ